MPLTDWMMVSKPRLSRHGPACPKAESVTYTMPGRSRATSSGLRPRRASAPGRYDWQKTSAWRRSARSCSASAVCRMSRGGELAEARVDDEAGQVGQMRRAHYEHLGAERREGAPAHRPRDDAGEIQHAEARERAWPVPRGLRRALADLD